VTAVVGVAEELVGASAVAGGDVGGRAGGDVGAR